MNFNSTSQIASILKGNLVPPTIMPPLGQRVATAQSDRQGLGIMFMQLKRCHWVVHCDAAVGTREKIGYGISAAN